MLESYTVYTQYLHIKPIIPKCQNGGITELRDYFYFIVEIVELKSYIFEAPPLVMVIENAHTFWEYYHPISLWCGDE